MNDRSKLALAIIGGGVFLGIAGDALLRIGPWGINLLLWTDLLLGVTLLLAWRGRVQLDRRAVWMLAIVIFFAAGIGWRDSETLKFLDFLAVVLVLALAVAWARGGRMFTGGLYERVSQVGRATFDAAAGYIPMLTSDVRWPKLASEGWGHRARSLAVGLCLALPLLVLFGALLASADVVFRTLLTRIVNIDLSDMVSHLGLTAVCAWFTGGYLTGLLFRNRTVNRPGEIPRFITLGPIEVGVALGLLNALFAAFVAVQVRYLFGGDHLVEVTLGLTYAEYARQGFFQLVAVVALALPALLGADWLLGESSKSGFRLQACIMLLLLAVILASAFHRMRLYQAEYGWTELRFYVTAFMLWVAVAFVWFALTVLVGRQERFASGAIAAGLVLLGVINAVNPDAWIARRNLAHARAGHAFDAAYIARLSGDAVPGMGRARPTLAQHDQETISRWLRGWRRKDVQDWRVWSWSRAEARRALAEVLPGDRDGPAQEAVRLTHSHPDSP